MKPKDAAVTPAVHDYVVERSGGRDEVLRLIEEETSALGDVAVMQTSAEQAALLELLVRAVGARDAVEVGTFTGYGAIRIARGLADGGRLICCEIDERWAETATRNIERAGLGDRVEVRVGPALDTLRSLPAEPSFDFAYLDADKPGYPAYYEELVARLRPGGLLAVDNVLLGGRVLDPPPGDASAAAMAELNDRVPRDERVDSVMLALADGVTLARRR